MMSEKHSVDTMRIWGSGLLAVDVVMGSDGTDVYDITSGGTCGNVLSILAMLGWSSTALGRIGIDRSSEILKDSLENAGVDVSLLHCVENIETPLIIERFGVAGKRGVEHRFEWKCPSCGAYVPRFTATPRKLIEQTEAGLVHPHVFFYDRPTPANVALAERLRSKGSIVMFEPPRMRHDSNFARAVKNADIVKMADVQSIDLAPQGTKDTPLTLLTFGERGVAYRARGFQGVKGEWEQLPAVHISSTVDTCGSGDWLSAGLIHALLGINETSGDIKARLVGAIKFGQTLAALNCLLPGARGLMRVFNRNEITDMVAISLAEGISDSADRVSAKSDQRGAIQDISRVCVGCNPQGVMLASGEAG